MKPASEDVSDRRPVWEVLSFLFLDTELESNNFEEIVTALAQSPYSIKEIEDILFDEVYPICIWNLRSLAGVWAGFDIDWLESAILNRAESTFKLPRWMQMGHWMIRQPWQKVIELYELRSNK
jgi:hypothetical protein